MILEHYAEGEIGQNAEDELAAGERTDLGRVSPNRSLGSFNQLV